MNTIITSKSGMEFSFRELQKRDSNELGKFFESLSENTHSKFGPHPLNMEHANFLCGKIGQDNIIRFVVLNEERIVGYFIIDFNPYEHEAARYRKFGVELDPEIDPVFAPCIADDYQNQGIAGKAMELIIDFARSRNLRSLVLMGGTQEPNILARSFYRKYGFRDYHKFFTDNNELYNFDMMLLIDPK